MSLKYKRKTYNWARYGGIEPDITLNTIKYELEIQFPVDSYDKPNNIYKFHPINIDLNDDIYIVPPSSVYHIDWGDGSNNIIDFREFTDDWSHIYIRNDDNNTDRIRFTVVIKGHKLVQRHNAPGYDFIAQVKKTYVDAAFNNECLIILRSVEP